MKAKATFVPVIKSQDTKTKSAKYIYIYPCILHLGIT